MNYDMIQSAVRSLMSWAGTALVTHHLISAGAQATLWEPVSGLALAGVAFVWSQVFHFDRGAMPAGQ